MICQSSKHASLWLTLVGTREKFEISNLSLGRDCTKGFTALWSDVVDSSQGAKALLQRADDLHKLGRIEFEQG